MALVKVYSPEGVEQEVETVDAREMMRYNGYTMQPLAPKAPEEAPAGTQAEDPVAPPATGTPAAPWNLPT